jgi:hypothetical protein
MTRSRIHRDVTNLPTLKEADYRLKKSLMNVKVRVQMDPDVHVPDLLTRIRILASVAIVNQTMKTLKTQDGREFIEVIVKFMPNPEGAYTNMLTMAKMIKGMPGIKSVRIVDLSGKPVTFEGKPIVV